MFRAFWEKPRSGFSLRADPKMETEEIVKMYKRRICEKAYYDRMRELSNFEPFVFEQSLFQLGIVPETANSIFRENAMARDDYSYRVRSDCGTDSPTGLWFSEGFRYFAVCGGFSRAEFGDLSPDRALKICSPEWFGVEFAWQISCLEIFFQCDWNFVGILPIGDFPARIRNFFLEKWNIKLRQDKPINFVLEAISEERPFAEF